ncbi:hypothetical protein IAU60_001680 [Kwoniella sp. DSM 27419]
MSAEIKPVRTGIHVFTDIRTHFKKYPQKYSDQAKKLIERGFVKFPLSEEDLTTWCDICDTVEANYPVGGFSNEPAYRFRTIVVESTFPPRWPEGAAPCVYAPGQINAFFQAATQRAALKAELKAEILKELGK